MVEISPNVLLTIKKECNDWELGGCLIRLEKLLSKQMPDNRRKSKHREKENMNPMARGSVRSRVTGQSKWSILDPDKDLMR